MNDNYEHPYGGRRTRMQDGVRYSYEGGKILVDRREMEEAQNANLRVDSGTADGPESGLRS